MDLLSIALENIPSQEVTYYRATGRTLNAAGMYEPGFAVGVTVTEGSVQAVPRSSYEIQGLEQSKKYVNWFVSKEVLGLERGSSGDQFSTADGARYQIVNTTDWHLQDGWVQALSVKL